MKHRIATALTLTAALGSATVAQAQGGNTPAKPKLAVVLVLDQFRAEYLTRYAPFFGEGGFKWLMRTGATVKDAHYTYATTYTGPGHALILSGTYGHTNGIIGNRWYNRTSKQTESMFYDAKSELITVGMPKFTANKPGDIALSSDSINVASLLESMTPAASTLKASPKDDDTSPRNFIGNNLSDQLLLANNFRSKAIGLSNKDRAAIMLAGKLGKAYWYHEAAGGMISSSYYSRYGLPRWVEEFNARKLPETYMGKTWTKLLPESAYAISRTDAFDAETDFKGLGKTFPHTLTDKTGKPTADFYEAFTATPWANDYQLELARKAIEAEQLGADAYTDILGVSITATDIAGHSWGPDSHEVQDMIVRLDGQLADFFTYLNKRFKKGEVLIALTSDHGACSIPEYSASIGLEAARIKKKQLNEAIDTALDARYGKPEGGAKWVLVLEDPGIFLNHDLLDAKKLDRAEVERIVGEATLTVPGVTAFFTRSQFLSGNLPPNRWASYFEKSFYAPRSGDVLIQTKPFYFWGSYGERDTGSTHGSPYEYDTHVPMLFNGPGVKPGSYTLNADMTDFAPTLAALLGITAPAGNEGKRLSEVLTP